MSTVLRASRCSKWYGQILGLSELDLVIDKPRGRGQVIGLLGPNGAGKSTLIQLAAGLLRPSHGRIEVLGACPVDSTELRARIGYSPAHEGGYDQLSALEFVSQMARLSGLSADAADTAARAALQQMGLAKVQDRGIAGFSKGMRQRTKLAQATAHRPELLLLDEPLTGVDPLARAEIKEYIRALAADDRTVLVSSHVLHEIEEITDEIIVIYRGQLLAKGKIREIRALIDRHPHRIAIDCEEPRRLAAELVRSPAVRRISVSQTGLVIESNDPDTCYAELTQRVCELGLEVHRLHSEGNSLEAVFQYLTGTA